MEESVKEVQKLQLELEEKEGRLLTLEQTVSGLANNLAVVESEVEKLGKATSSN